MYKISTTPQCLSHRRKPKSDAAVGCREQGPAPDVHGWKQILLTSTNSPPAYNAPLRGVLALPAVLVSGTAPPAHVLSGTLPGYCKTGTIQRAPARAAESPPPADTTRAPGGRLVPLLEPQVLW